MLHPHLSPGWEAGRSLKRIFYARLLYLPKPFLLWAVPPVYLPAGPFARFGKAFPTHTGWDGGMHSEERAAQNFLSSWAEKKRSSPSNL